MQGKVSHDNQHLNCEECFGGYNFINLAALFVYISASKSYFQKLITTRNKAPRSWQKPVIYFQYLMEKQ